MFIPLTIELPEHGGKVIPRYRYSMLDIEAILVHIRSILERKGTISLLMMRFLKSVFMMVEGKDHKSNVNHGIEMRNKMQTIF
jgi:hypothetical protein